MTQRTGKEEQRKTSKERTQDKVKRKEKKTRQGEITENMVHK